ncbi:MAG: PilZ domain-containing protein [Acidobacteria bacterium]|nr:PilZ domain-containing protein [Acidobacteriota bacterium]MBV9623317.1 PilZ domain-containing protein [Acidobacteriota bacterium]
MREIRIHVALPVRVSSVEKQHSITEFAYTIDVSPRGARLAGIRELNETGRLIVIRRKTSEARFRVVWVGKAPSPQQGQVGVECVEIEKIIWDVDFKKVREDFEAIGTQGAVTSRPSPAALGRPASYKCDGVVKVWADEEMSSCFEAKLLAIGLGECQLEPAQDVPRNRSLLLELHLDEIEVTVKGRAYERESSPGTWIEFTHIRRGDHHVLQALTKRLADNK